jgi:hypothetical protein
MGASPLEGIAVTSRVATALLVCTCVCGTAASPALAAEQQDRQKTTVVVVVGASGTGEYATQFAQWAGLWQQACSQGGADFVAIGLDEGAEPDDRKALQETLTRESRESAAALWLVLIGHGTFDGRTARFNLRGPDVSAADLAEWVKPVPRPVAVVNCASSSAPFLVKLSAPGRVVITATKSGFEHNYARFGRHMAEAIAEPKADLDKDGQTSLLEAFLTASGRVNEFYSAEGRLVTEHAILDDNGDGLGTRADWFRGIRPVEKAQDDAPLDGYRAHQFHLVRSDAERKMPPDLRAQRDRLELEVMKLRDTKEDFAEDEYFSKLEALLYQITQIYEQTDEPNQPAS